MANQSNTPKYSPAQIYGDAGLIYIRYRAQIETKPNGQKKIGGSPNRSNTSLDPAAATLSSWVASSNRVVCRSSSTSTTKPTTDHRAASI